MNNLDRLDEGMLLVTEKSADNNSRSPTSGALSGRIMQMLRQSNNPSEWIKKI